MVSRRVAALRVRLGSWSTLRLMICAFGSLSISSAATWSLKRPCLEMASFMRPATLSCRASYTSLPSWNCVLLVLMRSTEPRSSWSASTMHSM